MKKISLCFNDRKRNKKQKLENFFWGGVQLRNTEEQYESSAHQYL